jgi:hypothetical protein
LNFETLKKFPQGFIFTVFILMNGMKMMAGVARLSTRPLCGITRIPHPPMTTSPPPPGFKKVLFLEAGVGTDQHGQNLTKACVRACKDVRLLRPKLVSLLSELSSLLIAGHQLELDPVARDARAWWSFEHPPTCAARCSL